MHSPNEYALTETIFRSANRNEFALTKSHQARVTKDLQHDNACREQRGRSVYDANKKVTVTGMGIYFPFHMREIHRSNLLMLVIWQFTIFSVPVNRDGLTTNKI